MKKKARPRKRPKNVIHGCVVGPEGYCKMCFPNKPPKVAAEMSLVGKVQPSALEFPGVKSEGGRLATKVKQVGLCEARRGPVAVKPSCGTGQLTLGDMWQSAE